VTNLASASVSPSGDFQIDCGCPSPLAFLNVETDTLTIIQPAQAGSFHGTDVYEDILRAIVGLDEAIPFLGVEPLNRS